MDKAKMRRLVAEAFDKALGESGTSEGARKGWASRHGTGKQYQSPEAKKNRGAELVWKRGEEERRRSNKMGRRAAKGYDKEAASVTGDTPSDRYQRKAAQKDARRIRRGLKKTTWSREKQAREKSKTLRAIVNFSAREAKRRGGKSSRWRKG